MKYVFCAFCIAAGSVAAAPLQAAEKVYDCSASFNTTRGFIAPRVVFFVDADKGTVRVLDGIIQSVNGGPIDGVLRKRSDKVHRIDWRVDDMPSDAGGINVTYRANLNHVAKTYTMEAGVAGYDNDARGRGSCALAK